MNLRTWTTVAALALAPAAAFARTSHPAHAAKAVRTIDIAVTPAGFVPDSIAVKAGETVKLVVTRKTEQTCAKEVVIRDLGVNKALPLNVPVAFEITPKKAGKIRYACGMDMVAGTITVE